MKRIILSCDRCGSPHDVHERVYLEMGIACEHDSIVGRQTARRYGHDQPLRDLCEGCCREIKDQTSEIWLSTKPEELKLKEVK